MDLFSGLIVFFFFHEKGKYITLPLGARNFFVLKSFRIFCWAEVRLFVSVSLLGCCVCMETG